MKRITLLVFLLLTSLNAQQGISIQLDIFQDLSTIDLAAFMQDKNIANQPRIMRVSIFPENVEVIVEGFVEWKKDENSSFVRVVYFKTNPFLSRSFYNDELDNGDLIYKESELNSNIISDIVNIGKPRGIFRVVLKVQDINSGAQDEEERTFTFLNTTAPEITSPLESEEVDVGNIIITWDKSIGASSYIVKANYKNDESSAEDALNSGNPLVDNLEVDANTTQINLTNYLGREVLPDTNVVVSVAAKIEGAGEVLFLRSKPRVFRTSSTAGGETESMRVVNPVILRLANFLQNKISPELVNKLLNGEISPEKVKIFDSEGTQLDFSDLNAILDYLDQNERSIISVEFNNR